jgi:hypothetical protein
VIGFSCGAGLEAAEPWGTGAGAPIHDIGQGEARISGGGGVMSAQFRQVRLVKGALALAAVVLCLTWSEIASAYTVQEAKAIFDILDSDHDGKVTRLEFETNKIDAFFFRNRADPQDPRMRFEDTGLSRAFFDQADHGHKGYLTGLDLVDAIRFEMIDAHHRGYFDFNELMAGLKTIGR